MFHNQRLSLPLADLFPLPPISLIDLPPSLQQSLCQSLSPSMSDSCELRPTQATTPMGFSWSVDIGHFSAREIIRPFIGILKTRRDSTPLQPAPNFLCKSNVPITLAKDRPLICHIIDDLTIITVDWPKDLLRAWKKILQQLFAAAFLPISDQKSCPFTKSLATLWTSLDSRLTYRIDSSPQNIQNTPP